MALRRVRSLLRLCMDLDDLVARVRTLEESLKETQELVVELAERVGYFDTSNRLRIEQLERDTSAITRCLDSLSRFLSRLVSR
jgi:hypothetical protein